MSNLNDTERILLGTASIAVGIWGGGGPMMIQLGIGLILMAAAPDTPGEVALLKGRGVTTRSPTAPWKIIYGYQRVGGTYAFIRLTGDDKEFLNLVIVLAGHEVNDIGSMYFDGNLVPLDGGGNAETFLGTQNFTADVSLNRVEGIDNTGMELGQAVKFATTGTLPAPLVEDKEYFIIAIAGDYIKVSSRFNGSEVNITDTGSGTHSVGARSIDYTGFVHAEFKTGSTSQTAMTALVNQVNDSGVWGTNHRLRGKAYAWVRLKWDKDIFPNGIPNITFDVQGKKIFDPVISSTAFTNNPALVIYDYLTDADYGVRIPAADIDLAAITAAKAACNEPVDLAETDLQEARYTCDGTLTSSVKHSRALRDLLGSMAGKLVFVDGTYKIYAGVYRAPTVSALTQDEFGSSIQVQNLISRQESFNAVKGLFLSPENRWQLADYPPVTNSLYESEDGEQVFRDLSLPFTISSSMAQRLAKIMLEQARQSITAQVTGRLSAYRIEPPDVVDLTYDRLGWSAKPFELQEGSLSISPTGVVHYNMLLRETASGVFDWNSGEETTFDLARNTFLPDVFSVAPPTSLVLTSGTAELDIRLDGTIFSRIKASWTASADIYVTSGGEYRLRYRKSPESGETVPFRIFGFIPGDVTEVFILDVEDGVDYDVDVFAVNSLGKGSDPLAPASVLNHFVLGKEEKPTDVTNLGGTVEAGGIRVSWDPITDLDLKEYHLKKGASWAAGTIITRRKATEFFDENVLNGDNVYHIKAIDTTLNESTNEDSDTTVYTPPPAPATLTGTIIRGGIKLTWPATTVPLNLSHYEVRKGASWAAGDVIAELKSRSYVDEGVILGNNVYHIKAIDVFDFESVSETSETTNYPDPPDVASFFAAQNAGAVIATWNDVTFINLHGYIVRYRKQVQTRWTDGLVITDTDRTTSHTTVAVPPGTWTIMVKAVDLFGFESVNEATVDLTVLQINAVVVEDEHSPLWAQTLTNLHLHYTGRLPIADQVAASGDDFNLFDTYIQTPFATSYYTTQVYTLAIATDVRLFSDIEAELHPDETTGVAAVTLQINIDPDGTGFLGWEDYNVGLRTVSSIQFRMKFDNALGEAVGIGFEVTIDQPPREERDKDVEIAANGTTIVFATQYLETPIIKITVLQQSGSPVFAGYRNKSTTQFDAHVFDNDGVDVGGFIDWEATNI